MDESFGVMTKKLLNKEKFLIEGTIIKYGSVSSNKKTKSYLIKKKKKKLMQWKRNPH